MRKLMLEIAMMLMSVMILAEEMTIIKDGVCKVPVIVSEKASGDSLLAANHLAEYVQKISGALPSVLNGFPKTIPDSAIWIGYQPVLKTLFPNVNFNFQHPEEILIVCNGRHLAILGSEKIVEGIQLKDGTPNAVYTFLQKHLDVRWFYPGPLGEDVIRRQTIKFPPFEYRFHPQFLRRAIYRRYFNNKDWCRFQRLMNDTLNVPAGHGFDDWWEKYSKEHPDYFALQPNGKRDGYPGTNKAKICDSNPKVWDQFLLNVDEELKKDPTANVFNASPNDSYLSGYCVCQDCEAWDAADAPKCNRNLEWQNLKKEHVALTDRYAKFWNVLGRRLKELHPERELWIYGMAYGDALITPPVKEVLDKNIVIGFVGSFPITCEERRQEEKATFKQWKEKAKALVYRPNLFWYSGGMAGFPTIAIKKTIEDFRFLAENNCIGLIIDTTPQHWATQGPQYYVMAQMAWDPFQDGDALLEDYYRRCFGKAADSIRSYCQLMEDAHNRLTETPGWKPSMGMIRKTTDELAKIYDSELVNKADTILKKAESELQNEPEIYRKRVALMRSGLDFTKLQTEIINVMRKVRESGDKDKEANEKAMALSIERRKFFKLYDGIAINDHIFNVTWLKGHKMESYMGYGPEGLPTSSSEKKKSPNGKDAKDPAIRDDVQ